jgi:hypothetical protein
VALSSSYRWFGGISACNVQSDGAHFIALSDRGLWLRGRIVYDGDRPSGIADAEMAAILAADSEPPGYLDVESIAENGGILYVGVERINSILRFDYSSGFHATGRPIAIPSEIKSCPVTKVWRRWPCSQGLRLAARSWQYRAGLNALGNIRRFGSVDPRRECLQ